MPLTKERFAQQCAYITRFAAAWTSDTLDTEAATSPETVARFTGEMKQRLAHLEAIAGAPSPDVEARKDAVMDSQYLAGVTAGWNAAQADDPNAALQRLVSSRDGYLAALKPGGTRHG